MTGNMKVMILAAGKGERMRPLTDSCPKPLQRVKGKTLIEHTIEKLKRAKFSELVINISYLGNMIEEYLGDGSRCGVNIIYSREEQPLETGGGIARAMPLLCAEGEKPFLLVNADVWCDLDLALPAAALKPGKLAHLVLVANPAYKLTGDFALRDEKVAVLTDAESGFTYSGISVIHPQLFKRYPSNREKFPLLEPLLQAIKNDEVSGEIYDGTWVDVGTPERLLALQ
jgi:N-acetyl-alpha-D-muramate 1-phosphate uridylyltransferase